MIASPPLPQGAHCTSFHLLPVILIAFNILKVISGHEMPPINQVSTISPPMLPSSPAELMVDKINGTSVRLWIKEKLDSKITNLVASNYIVKYKMLIEFPRMMTDPCKDDRDALYFHVHEGTEDLQRHVEICSGQVYMFGGYNDTVGTDYDHLLDYCKTKDVYLKRSGEHEFKPIILNDLLPRRKYIFDMEIIHNLTKGHHSSNARQKLICTNDSSPLYPPQTDYGSFRVRQPSKDVLAKNSKLADTRLVDVYFRPVPAIISDHGNLNYAIECHTIEAERMGAKSFTENITDASRGRVEVPTFTDTAYSCALWARNPIGRSANTSLISIPPQRSILNTKGKFNLYVVETSKDEYLLKWNDMDDVIKRDKDISAQVKTLFPNTTGPYTRAYTVYWCMMSGNEKDCTSIEGMVKTGRTFLSTTIPGDHSVVFNRVFGISYRSISNKLFTGIIWSTCVGHLRSEAHYMNHGLQLYHGGLSDDKAILISWTFNGCEGLTSLVQEYEVNYCALQKVSPCESIENSPPVDYFRGWSHKDCLNFTFPNNLTFNTRIENLNSSTNYIVRIRAFIGDENERWGNISWSEPILSATEANPQAKKKCSSRSIPFMISLVALTFISLIMIYLAAKRVSSHSYDLFYRYSQTNTIMPQRFDDVLRNDDNHSETGLRYWINRIPMGAMCLTPNLESKNLYKFDAKTNTITEIDIVNNLDGDDQLAFQATNNEPDYVPTQMLTSQADQSPVDSMEETRIIHGADSLSDTDDVSVCSHSSFLANILNDRPPTNSDSENGEEKGCAEMDL